MRDRPANHVKYVSQVGLPALDDAQHWPARCRIRLHILPLGFLRRQHGAVRDQAIDAPILGRQIGAIGKSNKRVMRCAGRTGVYCIGQSQINRADNSRAVALSIVCKSSYNYRIAHRAIPSPDRLLRRRPSLVPRLRLGPFPTRGARAFPNRRRHLMRHPCSQPAATSLRSNGQTQSYQPLKIVMAPQQVCSINPRPLPPLIFL